MQIFLSLSTLVASAYGAGVGNFYTYYEAGGLGPRRWQFLDAEGNQCGGTQGISGYGQSPVTISDAVRSKQDQECDTNKKQYNFTAGTCKWEDLEFSISNNGVKVEPKSTTNCIFGQMRIPHTPNSFKALQFHIHTYSEHQIEHHPKSIRRSGYFQAELHVVHQEEIVGGSFAVFGTMMSVSSDPDYSHEDFEQYLLGWEKVATMVSAKCPTPSEDVIELASIVQVKTSCGRTNSYRYPYNDSHVFPDRHVDLYNGIPSLPETQWGTFTYKGGLTTPGCTEIVNWNLLDEPMEISQNQLNRLEYLIHCYTEGSDAAGNIVDPLDSTFAAKEVKECKFATVASESGSTSRPPQPLLGRQVLHRCTNGPDNVVNDIGTPKPPHIDQKPARAEEPLNTNNSPKCDRGMREGCSADKRYNPKASPNLKVNAPQWYDAEGYWVGTKTVYSSSGDILLETFASDKFKNTKPYPQDEVYVFMNRTVKETRFFEHSIEVYKRASPTLFCTYALPTESRNVLGAGKCGENGYALHGEKFGVATFEKDGVAEIFYANGLYSGAKAGRTFPIDSDTFYSTVSNDDFQYSETFAFSNSDHTEVQGTGQFFLKQNANPLAESYSFHLFQVTEEDYKKKLAESYQMNGVLEAEQIKFISSGNCLDTNNCPTDAEYQAVDPLYNDSPYEDDSQLKGGWIAFFVVIGALVMIAVLLCLHNVRLQQQADRYKHQFARRVAETIQIDGSHDKLQPGDLQKEFAKIDTSGRGYVTKAELREFMGSRMNDKDFNVMFAAIDLDHNGTMEFSEFVAFMAQIGAIYDEEEVAVHKAPEKSVEAPEKSAEPAEKSAEPAEKSAEPAE